MNALARLFAALSRYFESKATSQGIAARMASLEAEMAKFRGEREQMRLDIAKCKLIVGIHQITDVTASEV